MSQKTLLDAYYPTYPPPHTHTIHLSPSGAQHASNFFIVREASYDQGRVAVLLA